MKNTEQTSTLSDALKRAIDARLLDLHTSMPARVESFDPATGYASIQPEIKRKFKNQNAVDLPLITDVPIMFTRTQSSHITLPVKKGDIGHLVFSERSLDRWKEFGGSQDPQDPRKHDLSDCVFYLGGYPSNKSIDGFKADMIHIKNESGEIMVDKLGDLTLKNDVGEFLLSSDGKIKIAGSTGEIIDLLSQLLAKLQTHSHGHPMGPTGPPLPPELSDFGILQTSIDGMKVD